MFGREISSVHFIGICGTAMASVAAALRERGIAVTGSDEGVYPPMSTFLEERGIAVQSGFSAAHLDRAPDLVVIGNAMSRGNPEVEATLAKRLRYCSLPELLKEGFIRGKRSVVVAGTHGKTTTTSLLAWVFEHNGRHPGFLIGGIPANLGQGARFTDGEWFILEGDEYDTAFFDKRSKFLHYLPEVAILNNLEFDHADIFDDLAAVRRSFSHFIRLVPPDGLLLANGDDPNLADLIRVQWCPVRRFGLGADNEVRAEQLCLRGEGSEFQVSGHRFRIPLVGELNVRNALAVVAAARHCGFSDDQIQAAFDTFRGIKRRLEVRGEADGVTVVDDFGHHPTAIRETMHALRIKFPGRRLWAVFEPRSNTTRRNVFQRELARALSMADGIVVSEVARLALLKPEERLDPERLMADVRASGRPAAYLPDVERILAHLVEAVQPGDVVCVFSNGGFGGIHGRLLEALRSRAKPARP
jgi:UDP-N-acetylmuramate: L-alanyl-gamma-D-glutamyl-meso-diaminopimelate ligase